MLKGFKDFLFRGNIVDLAVAVVIGTAFTALVSTLTASLIEPIINSFGGASVDGLSFRIIEKNAATTVDIAAIINAIITFVITAAVVYLIFVVPWKKLMERLAQGQEEEPAGPTEDVLLLREIRDLLGGDAAQRGPGSTPPLP
ncbi:large conductance mechanosensitive channel protein MscL [Aeromicrobium sp. 179-A 4D2 NHS]|uniref:large conductance mechanosensitive channel protein MscL n=1 Tax=Aeromicrobium sp. 179-A 4D2 NHS TaxID=3142375 RepID=UPI0039A3E495